MFYIRRSHENGAAKHLAEFENLYYATCARLREMLIAIEMRIDNRFLKPLDTIEKPGSKSPGGASMLVKDFRQVLASHYEIMVSEDLRAVLDNAVRTKNAFKMAVARLNAGEVKRVPAGAISLSAVDGLEDYSETPVPVVFAELAEKYRPILIQEARQKIGKAGKCVTALGNISHDEHKVHAHPAVAPTHQIPDDTRSITQSIASHRRRAYESLTANGNPLTSSIYGDDDQRSIDLARISFAFDEDIDFSKLDQAFSGMEVNRKTITDESCASDRNHNDSTFSTIHAGDAIRHSYQSDYLLRTATYSVHRDVLRQSYQSGDLLPAITYRAPGVKPKAAENPDTVREPSSPNVSLLPLNMTEVRDQERVAESTLMTATYYGAEDDSDFFSKLEDDLNRNYGNFTETHMGSESQPSMESMDLTENDTAPPSALQMKAASILQQSRAYSDAQPRSMRNNLNIIPPVQWTAASGPVYPDPMKRVQSHLDAPFDSTSIYSDVYASAQQSVHETPSHRVSMQRAYDDPTLPGPTSIFSDSPEFHWARAACQQYEEDTPEQTQTHRQARNSDLDILAPLQWQFGPTESHTKRANRHTTYSRNFLAAGQDTDLYKGRITWERVHKAPTSKPAPSALQQRFSESDDISWVWDYTSKKRGFGQGAKSAAKRLMRIKD